MLNTTPGLGNRAISHLEGLRVLGRAGEVSVGRTALLNVFPHLLQAVESKLVTM